MNSAHNSIRILALIVLLFSIMIYSQSRSDDVNWPELKFEHFTMADGLPENSVLCILQDRLGYLWFGTQVGLVRYDGYKMKDYQYDPDDSLSLSWGLIKAIYEDKSGTLWIGTAKGFNRFDRATENFTRFLHRPNDMRSINSDSINCIFEDNYGNILVGTNKGLNLFNPNNKNFTQISYHKSIYSNSIKFITKDKLTGKIYVGSKNKILIYDSNKQFLTDDKSINDLISTIGSINSLYQSGDGLIWIGHSMGLTELDLKNNTVKNYQAIPSSVYNISNDFHNLIEDNSGLLWLISGSGENGNLMIFNSRNEKFISVKHITENPKSISSSRNIWTIYKDRSGIIWVGTYLNGLNKWDSNKYKFKRFEFDPGKVITEDFNKVWSIIEDEDGIIWFGTNRGLNSFNRTSGEFRNYKYDPRGTDNTVTFIHKDETGIIWLGTEMRGLVRFDPLKETYFFYSNNKGNSASISHNTIRYILPDSNDILWVGTRGGGLNKFDKRTGNFIRYLPEPDNSNSLSHERVECIRYDSRGTLWVGAQGVAGLNRFDNKTNSFKSFSFSGGGPVVLTMLEDKRGNFWVGTFNRGISLFDRNSETFVYNIELANNLVRSILEDDSGNLWIGTDYGLSRVNTETKIVKNYSTSENFEGDRFSAKSAFKTSTGEMLFGTYDGFILFHPESIKDNTVSPQVVISDVSLFNRPGEKLNYDGLMYGIQDLNLSYSENDLRFDYVGLHFADPSKNNYKYMLEGYDQDWIDAGKERNANYTNLNPGEYIFKVMAANCDGVWSPNEASIKITINNPWWSTGWAYTFYLILFAYALYSVRRFELNRSRLKSIVKMREFEAKKQQEVDEMKSRFIANLSHEFRTPLMLIKGPLQQMKEDNLDSQNLERCELIYRNTENLQQLINQLLELSQLESASIPLKAEKLNLLDSLKGLIYSFESLAKEKNITLEFEFKEEPLTAWIDRDKFEKIINNLFSNAFKFTNDGGRIIVLVEKIISDKAEFVEIKLKDSGIGIPDSRIEKIFDRFYQVDDSEHRSYGGSGIGLALVKELVDLHRWTISVSSSEGKGTEFSLRIPLDDDYIDENQKVSPFKTDNVVVENKIINIAESKQQEIKKHLKKDESSDETNQDNKPCILIVEDSIDVQKYLDDLLNSGYLVSTAINGVEGLKIAQEKIPDLIISDVMMPEMNGFEFCYKIKTDERTSHVPVIILTAKATIQDKITGLETGADDYIMKPFESNELKVRIKNLIEQRKKLREYFQKQGVFNLKNARVTSVDKKFLEKAISIINNHISDTGFSVDLFADEIGMSRSQLHRKLVSLIGESPGDLIRRIRLTKAAKLIEQNFGNISEIALEVGFNNPANFAQSFKKQFSISPTEYKK